MTTRQEEIKEEIREARPEVIRAIAALGAASEILLGLPQCIIDHLAEVDLDTLTTANNVEEVAGYLADLEKKTK